MEKARQESELKDRLEKKRKMKKKKKATTSAAAAESDQTENGNQNAEESGTGESASGSIRYVSAVKECEASEPIQLSPKELLVGQLNDESHVVINMDNHVSGSSLGYASSLIYTSLLDYIRNELIKESAILIKSFY